MTKVNLKLIKEIKNAHKGAVRSLKYAPKNLKNDLMLLSGGDDGLVQAWQKGFLNHYSGIKYSKHQGGVLEIDCFSDMPFFVSTGEDGKVISRSLDGSKNELILDSNKEFPSNIVVKSNDKDRAFLSIARIPNSSSVIVLHARQGLFVWDLEKNSLLDFHADGLPLFGTKIVIAEKQKRFITNSGKAIYMLSVPTGELIRVFGGSPEGLRKDGNMMIFNLALPGDQAREKSVMEIVHENMGGHKKEVSCLALSTDEKFLLSGSPDRTLRRWDISDPSNIEPKGVKIMEGHNGAVTSVLFLPRSTKIAVSSSADGSVRLWNAESSKELLQIRVGTPLNAMTISDDGSRLAVGGDNGSIYIFDSEPAINYATEVEVSSSAIAMNLTSVTSEIPQEQLSVDDHILNKSRSEKKENIRGQSLADQKEVDQSAGAIYQCGDVIGDTYEIRKILGSGGFGEVYQVYDREFDEIYALKTLHDKFTRDSKIKALFQKEANILVDIGSHPNLIRVHRVIETSENLFITMEYIPPNEQDINSLAGYLEYYPPDLAQSLQWAAQICIGMEYAYSKGIRTHRDLKPENIMITQDGIAKVADFGLAGIIDSFSINLSKTTSVDRTQVGTGFGTPTHMPPEQFLDAASCDVRSDIYAFGILLFQMASKGKLPFWANPPKNTWLDWMELHKATPVPQLDSPFFPIILHCIEKKPDNRYQNFTQVRSDLEKVLKEQNQKLVMQRPSGYSSTDELLNKGRNLATLGRHEESIRSYDEALRKYPRNTGLLTLKGASLMHLERYEEAIGCFDKVLEIAPRNILALTNKASILRDLGRYEESTQCFDQVLKIDPDHGVALSNKGSHFSRLGRYEEAIHYYDKALDVDPRDATTLYNKANDLDELGRYEEALQCLDVVLEINQRWADALNNKGICLNNLRRYEEAIIYYDKTLEVDPNYKGVLYNKASCLDDLGYYEESIACYDKALQIDSQNPSIWSNKGISLEHAERYEEAIYCYDKALEIDPRHIRTLHAKGISFARLGHYDEAIRCYDQALNVDPHYIPALFGKGNQLSNLNRREESIDCYDVILRLDPRHTGALLNKSNNLSRLERYEEALRYCDKILEIAPHSLDALGNKIPILVNLKNYEEVILCCDKVLKIDPLRADVWNAKGISFYQMGRYEEANHCYDKALEIKSHDLSALGNKGLCLKSLGRYEESVYCFGKILEIDPANKLAFHNKGLCLASLGYFEQDIQKLEQSFTLNSSKESLNDMAEDLLQLAIIYNQQDGYLIARSLAKQAAHLWEQSNSLMKKRAQDFIFQIEESGVIYINDIIEDIQKANSSAEIQTIVEKYPTTLMDTETLDIFMSRMPQRQGEWLTQIINTLARSAHEVLLYKTNSLANLHVAVKQYPFMLTDTFIKVTQQIIDEQIPSQNRFAYKKSVDWLKQIKDQNSLAASEQPEIESSNVDKNKSSKLNNQSRNLIVQRADSGNTPKYGGKENKEAGIKQIPSIQSSLDLQGIQKEVGTEYINEKPSASAKTKNTSQIITAVFLLFLICFCCTCVLLSLVWLWNNGDALFHSMGIYGINITIKGAP